MADTSQGPGEDELQFSSVEPISGAAGPAGVPHCVVCQRPIADTYYAAGDKLLCPACRDQYEAALNSGSKVGRLAAATALGIVAGLVGAAVWFGIRKVSGSDFGLVAIGVGLLVGGAVRKGSGGRGGRGYQVLAVLLTYLAVAVNYAPDLVAAAYKGIKEHQAADARKVHLPVHAATTAPATQTAATQTTQAAVATADSDDDESDAGKPPVSGGKVVVAVLLLIVLGVVFILAGPIIVGFSSIIGALIIGIALWEAWKINTGRRATLAGPYSLETGTPAAPQP